MVSIRAAVHGPNPPPEAVMRRFPLATDTALAEEVSTSPVPKFAGPPGYDVPASTCQLPVLRLLPVKSSRKFWVQPAGVGGAAASAWNAVATGTATIAVAIEVAARILILVRCGVSGLAVPESGCAVIASLRRVRMSTGRRFAVSGGASYRRTCQRCLRALSDVENC
ncbi:hypothetical protein GCM10022255_058560 [Dactylosporangium darangshiense]|uniref:Uncharacterized protein n=1 Tax=Dactylosporangium darangshiense TaxID=579108 RepID=A0ABP8DEZ3_9ACTN